MKKEHLSTDKPPKSKEEKLDRQLEDSFPTSDPPSHSPGVVGAPNSGKRAAGEKNDSGSGHKEHNTRPSDRHPAQK